MNQLHNQSVTMLCVEKTLAPPGLVKTLNLFQNSPVTYHLSTVTCHMSPTPTATATDPPPTNCSTKHSRLVHQERTKKNPTNVKTQIIYENFPKKRVLSFEIKCFAILPEVSSSLGYCRQRRGQTHDKHIYGHCDI